MLSGQGLIRLGLDARTLNRERVRGMGKYVIELVARLPRHLPVRWELFSDRPDLPFHRPDGKEIGVHLFDTRGYRFHAWEQVALPRRVARLGLDLLHCPGTRVPWWQPCPTVVTVHDVLPWLGQEPDWPDGMYVKQVLPRAFARCAMILTDSVCSKHDLVRLWPGLRTKVRVVPLGVSDAFLNVKPGPLSDSLQALGIRQPYFLYLGGQIARKRLDRALQILEGLADPRVTLVVCGVDRQAEDEVRERVAPAYRSQVCFVPFVAEAEMPRLYQNAVAVLYPTLYEGFGFPVLEAQAVGTPVLHSAVGSLTELAGPGSVLLPVEDCNAWVDTCSSLLNARGMSPNPNAEAREWARGYSWDVCVARHADAYREVLGLLERQGQSVGAAQVAPTK